MVGITNSSICSITFRSVMPFEVVLSLLELMESVDAWLSRIEISPLCLSLSLQNVPILTARHVSNLEHSIYVPNLRGVPNAPKIEQCLMGCCVNLVGHTCDFSGSNLSNHEQLLWRHDNYADRICTATPPAVVDFEAEG
jgi:hypothetical protein